MTDNIMHWAGVLFNICSGIILITTVLSLFAYYWVTRGTGILELLLIWGVALGGSSLGSVIIGILGIVLARVTYNTSEAWAALVGALFGIFLSVPIGVLIGGMVGTLIATLLVYRNFKRPTLIASVSAFVMAAIISGLALVPIGFIFFAIGHI